MKDTSSHWLAWAVGRTRATGRAQSQTLGSLSLAPHQVRGANRLVEMASRYGGALLADATGFGKTRVALAAASALRRDSRNQALGPIVVCAPARVLPAWRAAIQNSGLVDVGCVSHYQLSRGVQLAPSVVIADEAHNFRNPASRRSIELARMCASVPVLLLTATPIANSIWDLHAILSMFLAPADLRPQIGCDLRSAFERAERGDFDLGEVMQHVCVRRTALDGAFKRPSARVHVLPYDPAPEEAWVWNHLEAEVQGITFALLKGDWPLGLLREHILRRWEAGAQAVYETVDYLTEFHVRWLQVHDAGGRLDRAEFQSLFGQDFRQGVLGFMFEPRGKPLDVVAIRSDLDRLQELRLRLAVACESAGMVEPIVGLLRRSPGKLLIFTSYVAAATSLYMGLTEAMSELAVGLLTGTVAQITGMGRVGPDEILRRFSPRSQGVSDLPAHQRVDVVVATDCVSEGVNLQDCGRVVLGDLPHSPLTIEQRVGRLLRPGSSVEQVDVYLPRPARWADTLGLRHRLATKMDRAQSAGAPYTTRIDTTRVVSSAPLNPLSALTDLDRLVEGAPQLSEGGRFFRAEVPTKRVIEVVVFSLEGLCWVEGLDQDGVLIALAEALPDLVRIMEARASLTAGSPSSGMLKRLADRRSAQLSAKLSPQAIGLDSVQARAWACLRAGAEVDDWDMLRCATLRPVTRGESMVLEACIRAGPREVERWVRGRVVRGESELELVGGLSLR